MSNSLKRFWKGDAGATAVEYGLMVALIAAVIIVAVTSIGTELKDVFTFVAGALGEATGTGT